MVSKSFMLIAGEASGDAVAAELVQALRKTPELAALDFPPAFFGAGGSKMAAAGVELAFDLTDHAVFGLSDALKHYFKFRRLFHQLFQLGLARQPEVIILVDYAGFNRRFARTIKRHVRARRGAFGNWEPKIVYYVSPQVWASRGSRAYQIARDVDLLLSIFPFEKEWYAQRVPKLRVEFVGHPILDRYDGASASSRLNDETDQSSGMTGTGSVRGARPVIETITPERAGPARSGRMPVPRSEAPLVVLLPGSRRRELETHLPVMIEALRTIQASRPIRARVVLPNTLLAELAAEQTKPLSDVIIETGRLAETLAQAELAIASSGTVTLECAFFRVPTVVLYKTSWLTYEIARRIVAVKHIAMPNILAGETVYPELIQNAATAENIAREALSLLNESHRRMQIQAKLAKVIESLGSPGASARAAQAIARLPAAR